jgi:4-hydroxy-tetrahydrodipicolinate synthase
MFTGCGTALVTPFRRDQSLDEETLRKLVRRQIDAGIDFLVPCGTTGESPTLTRAEHCAWWKSRRRGRRQGPGARRRGRIQHQRGDRARPELERMGADGILSVTPYYNKPTQEGLYQHYCAIASAIRLPIVVYSVQGRTGVNVEPATLARLAQIENIVGVKEASGNIGQMANVIHEVPQHLHRALGRRRRHHPADGAGRPRRHLGGLQRDSRPDDATGAVLSARRFRAARASRPAICR